SWPLGTQMIIPLPGASKCAPRISPTKCLRHLPREPRFFRWADTNVQECRHEWRHGRPEAHSTSAIPKLDGIGLRGCAWLGARRANIRTIHMAGKLVFAICAFV